MIQIVSSKGSNDTYMQCHITMLVGTHNLLKSDCSFWFCSSSIFYANLYEVPRAANQFQPLTNVASGGDGTPSSPEASLEPWSPPTGTQDKHFSDSDPLGNEEELNLGIAAMLAPMPECEENTP
jgi:hypothetical protein